ncbi:MAG: hypothetical protein WBO70_03525 [Erysipelotrichaceae bacterium]
MYRLLIESEQKCLICHKDLSNGCDILTYFSNNDIICCKCRKKLVSYSCIVEVKYLRLKALYKINDYFWSLIIRYKEKYDEALAGIFIHPFLKDLKKQYQGYTIIGVPSSLTKIKERGFNHLEMMFKALELPYYDLFEKDNYLQKKQNKFRRDEISNHIRLLDHQRIATPILLVDDVVTTGSSILCCYELLVNYGYQVEVLVIGSPDRIF